MDCDADHGTTLQAHNRRLRNPMANQPPGPLLPRELSPPTPRVHSHSQPFQIPRTHHQRIKRRSPHSRHRTKRAKPHHAKHGTRHRPNVSMVGPFPSNSPLPPTTKPCNDRALSLSAVQSGNDTATPNSPPSSTPAPCTTVSAPRV